MSAEITYRTHVLVAVRPNGLMTVIADWPHLPRQVDVLEAIREAREDYETFALCTPTSIIAAEGGGNDRAAWYNRRG